MKALVSISLLTTMALLVMATRVPAQSPSDRPRGVNEESWVSVSDSVGIVVTDPGAMPTPGTYHFQGNEPGVMP